MEQRRSYIPTLDGWRAIAILLVLANHDVVHRIGPIRTSWLTAHGGYGVDLFFSISGYLICTLLLDEQQSTGTISLRSFYLRRAFRILPAALTYLLVIAGLRWTGIISAVHPSEWLGSVFFFRNLQPMGPSTWYTSHFWSLSVEEHFYLILPSLLLVLWSRSRQRPTLLYVHGVPQPPGVNRRGLILFLIGILILPAGLYLSVQTESSVFSDYKLGAIFLAASAAIFLSEEAIRERVAVLLHPADILPLTAVVTVALSGRKALLLLPFFFLGSVVSTVLHPNAAISRVLESKVLRFIGKRSYSLYLWQQLFLSAHFGPVDMRLQRWPVSLVCSFVAACLSYALVERPMIRLGRRLTHRSSRSSTNFPESIPALSA